MLASKLHREKNQSLGHVPGLKFLFFLPHLNLKPVQQAPRWVLYCAVLLASRATSYQNCFNAKEQPTTTIFDYVFDPVLAR